MSLLVRGCETLAAGDIALDSSVCETSLEIKNTDGLHMRPAMQFVDLASQFTCKIQVSNADMEVDGKSIMQMSMLAATCGTRLTLRASGADAGKALEALRDLVEIKQFDE
jgi:phosphotransferase system HPr (HPr) family protein